MVRGVVRGIPIGFMVRGLVRRVRGMVRSGLWLILGARHGAWGGAR